MLISYASSQEVGSWVLDLSRADLAIIGVADDPLLL
jgi:hypothetical protein